MQVQDLAPVVGDDEKAVQNTKREPLVEDLGFLFSSTPHGNVATL
jgi:hypothetical protein